VQNMMLGSFRQQLCLLAAVLCSWQLACCDTIFIEKVTCKKVATGFEPWMRPGLDALAALWAARDEIQQGGATLMDGGVAAIGDLPLTVETVNNAVQEGWGQGTEAVNFLDSTFSGTDNLMININGEQVYPPGGGAFDINAGATIEPNIQFDFNSGCRIQFLEKDNGLFGSGVLGDSDNLGSIDVNPDVSPGEDYKVEEAILMNEDEGDLYTVTYRVERNDKGGADKRILCGTQGCKICPNDPCCESTNDEGLDTDSDKNDLRTCPPGMTHRGWKTISGWWSDKYLNICANEPASDSNCAPEARQMTSRKTQALREALQEVKLLREIQELRETQAKRKAQADKWRKERFFQ